MHPRLDMTTNRTERYNIKGTNKKPIDQRIIDHLFDIKLTDATTIYDCFEFYRKFYSPEHYKFIMENSKYHLKTHIKHIKHLQAAWDNVVLLCNSHSNMRKLAKEGYFKDTIFDYEDLMKLSYKTMWNHPAFLFLSTTGRLKPVVRTHCNWKGKKSYNSTNKMRLKTFYIRKRAEQGHYGDQFTQLDSLMPAHEIYKHPIWEKVNSVGTWIKEKAPE